MCSVYVYTYYMLSRVCILILPLHHEYVAYHTIRRLVTYKLQTEFDIKYKCVRMSATRGT